ncbi:vWA domain-containing protein [Tautonia sociabilis]|nr:vWA domain-containing protein [Tautonia sociabilis]
MSSYISRHEPSEEMMTAETTAAHREPAPEPAKAEAPPAKKKRRRRRGAFIWRWDAPSWGVSLMVHAAVLAALALMAVGAQVDEVLGSIDASMVDTSLSEERADELVKILADPAEERSELAVGDPTSTLSAGGTPTATPAIRSTTTEVSETKSLAGLIDVAVAPPSALTLPSLAVLNRDLAGGNKISGDPGRETAEIGEALDQIAREILRHLANSRVTVLWMFDESGSMKDDQRTIRDKFDRVASELKLRVPADRREAGDLEHAIIGFGKTIHFEAVPPRADAEQIRQAIDALPVDQSGEEQTMQAIVEAISRYGRAVAKDRKILLVLVTDESGDDGSLVEQARLALVNRGVTAYVLGRQAMFGYDRVYLRYVDPVTKDVYWPPIRRGPEAPGLELLQWDGLWTERHDEQPSGLAPYELARLAYETGGIYFLLPNEEELRNRPRGEKAFAVATLKEYLPDYGPRAEYASRVAQSELRRTMSDIIQLTDKDFGFRRHFPVAPPELAKAITEELPKVDVQLRALFEFEKRLRALEPARDTEASRRWQANYDLMLGQIVAFQVKAYEYRACLAEMVALANQGRLVPKNPPIPGERRTDWVIDHSGKRKAPPAETDKKYAEARRLLELVCERHPETPWADLARTTLDRGLGCDWNEWSVHPDYDERAKLVPNF